MRCCFTIGKENKKIRKEAEKYKQSVIEKFHTMLYEAKKIVLDCDGLNAQIAMIEYFISVLKIDLQVEGMWCKTYNQVEPIDFRHLEFPLSEDCVLGQEMVDLEGKIVLGTIWKRKSLITAITHMSTVGFQFDKGQHTGNYYPELELIVVGNGCHHLSISKDKNKN